MSGRGAGLRARLLSRPFQVLLDVLVLASALVVSYLLRFDFALAPAS